MHMCNGTEHVKEFVAGDEPSIQHALNGRTWRRVGIEGTPYIMILRQCPRARVLVVAGTNMLSLPQAQG